MKNRYAGMITVYFADGYVETCSIRERSNKGKDHFLKVVCECAKIILSEAPKGNTRFKYRGDFAHVISRHVQDQEKGVQQV